MESVTSGDSASPLRWTFQSSEKLAGELRADGYEVTGRSVSRLLHQLGYIVRTAREMPQERSHLDPDAQFLHVCRLAEEFQAEWQPVASVEAERKEIVVPTGMKVGSDGRESAAGIWEHTMSPAMIPTATSGTWSRTPSGPASEWTATPANSHWRHCSAGGGRRAPAPIRMLVGCW